MFATELELGPGAHDHRLIRWDLFLFRAVRDVLPGPRDGTVVVIHTGRARPDAWRAELRDGGLLTAESRPRSRD